MQLKSLNCNFVTEAELLKLNLANIQTTDQFITYADLNYLSELTKIPLKTLQLIRKFIVGQYAPLPEQGLSVFKRLERKLITIKTGCGQIDEIISNGIYSSEISEITGSAASGKTQFCLNLVANLISKKPYSNSVLYIDSNRGFCPIRIRQLVSNHLQEQPSDKVFRQILESIQVVECFTPFDLLDVLHNFKKPTAKFSNSCDNHLSLPTLLIIDNLNNLFCSLFKPNYSLESAFYLNCISNQLKYLAIKHNMAIVVTTNSCESRISNLFSLPCWVRFLKL